MSNPIFIRAQLGSQIYFDEKKQKWVILATALKKPETSLQFIVIRFTQQSYVVSFQKE